MNLRHSIEDDLQPASEEAAQCWLIEFSQWRFIRPAWTRTDGTNPRDLMPTAETAEYFGALLCKKFERALHQAFLGKPEMMENPVVQQQRACTREGLKRVPRPESWMDAWPAFWDFFIRDRPMKRTRLDSLFKSAWPMMDEDAAGHVMDAWEQSGRQASLSVFGQLAALGVNIPRTVCRMKARLNLPFKELAGEWCQNLGLKSQLETGSGMNSMADKRSASSHDDDGKTWGDTLADSREGDGAANAGLADLRTLLKLLPKAFFDDMTGKERAVVSLRMFDVPLYKPPVSGCPYIEPPRGRDALYRMTFDAVGQRIQQKARQIILDPVVQKLRPAGAAEDLATSCLVAAILDEDIRRVICASLGHPDGAEVQISEKAPSWLLDMLDSVKPNWRTMNTQALTKL